MVPGSVECKTCCLLYVTFVNSLSSASSTCSWTVLWCCSQRPWTADGVARFNWMNIQNVSTSRLYNGCTTGCKVYTDLWRKLIPVPRTAAVVLQRTISLYSAGSGNSLASRACPMHPRDAILQPQQPTTGRSVGNCSLIYDVPPPKAINDGDAWPSSLSSATSDHLDSSPCTALGKHALKRLIFLTN